MRQNEEFSTCAESLRKPATVVSWQEENEESSLHASKNANKIAVQIFHFIKTKLKNLPIQNIVFENIFLFKIQKIFLETAKKTL